jgi:hypothetical protein
MLLHFPLICSRYFLYEQIYPTHCKTTGFSFYGPAGICDWYRESARSMFDKYKGEVGKRCDHKKCCDENAGCGFHSLSFSSVQDLRNYKKPAERGSSFKIVLYNFSRSVRFTGSNGEKPIANDLFVLAKGET